MPINQSTRIQIQIIDAYQRTELGTLTIELHPVYGKSIKQQIHEAVNKLFNLEPDIELEDQLNEQLIMNSLNRGSALILQVTKKVTKPLPSRLVPQKDNLQITLQRITTLNIPNTNDPEIIAKHLESQQRDLLKANQQLRSVQIILGISDNTAIHNDQALQQALTALIDERNNYKEQEEKAKLDLEELEAEIRNLTEQIATSVQQLSALRQTEQTLNRENTNLRTELEKLRSGTTNTSPAKPKTGRI